MFPQHRDLRMRHHRLAGVRPPLTALANCYRNDPASKYPTLRFKTREFYDVLIFLAERSEETASTMYQVTALAAATGRE